MSSRRYLEFFIITKTASMGKSENTPVVFEEHPRRTVYWADLGVVCEKCGLLFGRRVLGVATFYEAKCDCCGETKVCTERRDYKLIIKE